MKRYIFENVVSINKEIEFWHSAQSGLMDRIDTIVEDMYNLKACNTNSKDAKNNIKGAVNKEVNAIINSLEKEIDDL